MVNNPLYDRNGLMPLYEQIPPNMMLRTTSLIDETQRATLSDTHIYSNNHQHISFTRENHYVDQPTCGLNNPLIIATDITEHNELVDPDSCFNDTFSSETQAKCIHDASPLDVEDNIISCSMIEGQESSFCQSDLTLMTEKQDEVVNVDNDKSYGILAPAGLL